MKSFEKEFLNYNQEKLVLFFLVKKYPNLPVVNFDKESVSYYKAFIKNNPKGFIAIRPPFIYEGETRYNDFSVFLPSGKSFSIECKHRKTSNLSAIHASICRTKNIIEQCIVFLFEGKGFNSNKNTIERFLHSKSKAIYSLNELALIV